MSKKARIKHLLHWNMIHWFVTANLTFTIVIYLTFFIALSQNFTVVVEINHKGEAYIELFFLVLTIPVQVIGWYFTYRLINREMKRKWHESQLNTPSDTE